MLDVLLHKGTKYHPLLITADFPAHFKFLVHTLEHAQNFFTVPKFLTEVVKKLFGATGALKAG